MSERTLRLLLGLYPARWRHRHGQELAQLLVDLSDEPRAPSQLRLFPDLLFGAIAQRVTVITPTLALGLAIVIAITGGAVYGASVMLLHPAPGRVVIHRDHAGRITAVTGAPVNVVLDPKTNKVISIHRKPKR